MALNWCTLKVRVLPDYCVSSFRFSFVNQAHSIETMPSFASSVHPKVDFSFNGIEVVPWLMFYSDLSLFENLQITLSHRLDTRVGITLWIPRTHGSLGKFAVGYIFCLGITKPRYRATILRILLLSACEPSSLGGQKTYKTMKKTRFQHKNMCMCVYMCGNQCYSVLSQGLVGLLFPLGLLCLALHTFCHICLSRYWGRLCKWFLSMETELCLLNIFADACMR